MLVDGPYTEMVTDEYRRFLRRIQNRANAKVVHHETCPCCGAKLVNLYTRDYGDGFIDIGGKPTRVWMCRRCWEKHDKEADHGK